MPEPSIRPSAFFLAAFSGLAVFSGAAAARTSSADPPVPLRLAESASTGERFKDLDSLVIGPMSGVDLDLALYLPYLPTRTIGDYERILAYLRGFPRAVDQSIALLAQGLAAGITPPRVTLRDVPGRAGKK